MRSLALLSALASLIISGTNAISKYDSERINRNEFVKAMQEIERERETQAHRRSLVDKILQMAKPLDRRLNDGNQYFKYQDVSDWNSAGNLAGMAIKYTGCQNIKRWDDYMAMYNDESPLIMDRFVTFRLCEADTCSAYNKLGCSYNYGEYILPMEDYLVLMAQYHFQQFSRYCKTCYHCMKLDYYKTEEEEEEEESDIDEYNMTSYDSFKYGDDYWAGYNRYWGEGNNNNGNRRRTGYSYYKQGGGAASYYYGDKGYNYSYGDDGYANDRKWYEDGQTGKCMFENVCTNFRSACKTFNPNATFYESYFTCSKFTVGYNYVYLAPHCRSDGHSIGIGVYSDATCSNFIGDELDISEFTGQTFDDKELGNYYAKTCLSCSAVDGYSLVTDDALGQEEELTYPLCTALYQNSAKCNVYAENFLNYNDDQSNQEANEQDVCEFLESLHDKSYNEYGTIVLRSTNNFDLANAIGQKEGFLYEASPLQQIGLVFSIILFLVLSVYSAYLTKKLYYRRAWRPPRSVHAPFSSGATVAATAHAVAKAGQMSRASSGIMAMRSGNVGGGNSVAAGSHASYLRDPWHAGDDYHGSSSRQKGHFA